MAIVFLSCLASWVAFAGLIASGSLDLTLGSVVQWWLISNLVMAGTAIGVQRFRTWRIVRRRRHKTKTTETR